MSPRSAAQPRRLVRFPQLKSEFGITWCRMHLDRLEKAGRFPRRIRIGGNSIAWFEDEIAGFIEARAAERKAVENITSH